MSTEKENTSIMLLLWRMSKEKKNACENIHCASCCLDCASIIECLSPICEDNIYEKYRFREKKKCGSKPCSLSCIAFRMFMKALGNE